MVVQHRTHGPDFPDIRDRDRGDSLTVKKSSPFPVPSLLYAFLILHTYNDVYRIARGGDRTPFYVIM